MLIGFSESAEYIATPTTVMREESFATQDLYQDAIGKTYRIYQATLDREPDQQGFEYWTDQLSSGQSVSDVISASRVRGSPATWRHHERRVRYPALPERP